MGVKIHFFFFYNKTPYIWSNKLTPAKKILHNGWLWWLRHLESLRWEWCAWAVVWGGVGLRRWEWAVRPALLGMPRVSGLVVVAGVGCCRSRRRQLSPINGNLGGRCCCWIRRRCCRCEGFWVLVWGGLLRCDCFPRFLTLEKGYNFCYWRSLFRLG